VITVSPSWFFNSPAVLCLSVLSTLWLRTRVLVSSRRGGFFFAFSLLYLSRGTLFFYFGVARADLFFTDRVLRGFLVFSVTVLPVSPGVVVQSSFFL